MTPINTYLSFNGNCREAMTFYQQCLGGELTFQTVGESPLSEKLPQQMKDCILHSMLYDGAVLLMGSDMIGAQGWIQGNNVSLSLACITETEIRERFSKLSSGGSVNHPLEHSFWGALFGDLTDRYGHHWILHYKKDIHQ